MIVPASKAAEIADWVRRRELPKRQKCNVDDGPFPLVSGMVFRDRLADLIERPHLGLEERLQIDQDGFGSAGNYILKKEIFRIQKLRQTEEGAGLFIILGDLGDGIARLLPDPFRPAVLSEID